MQLKKLFTLLAFLGIAASASADGVTFTALDGTQWGGGESGPEKLFDNTSQKWGSNMNAWFSFEASETIVLTGYAMRMGSDSKARNAGRSPKTWTIQGSNDKTSWKTIKQETDNNTMHYGLDDGDGSNSEKTFYFSLPDNYEPYKYYKFTFTAVQTSGEEIQLSELIPSYRLFNNSLTGVAGGHWWDEDPWRSMCDGDLNTRWCCGYWVNDGLDSRNYLILDAGSDGIELSSYMLVTGSDTQTEYNRNPTGWKIYGSNDVSPTKDGNWTPIVNISGNTTLEAKNKMPYVFDVSYGETGDPLSTPQSFRYYKFEVTSANSGGMYQLNEIVLNPKSVSHTCSSYYTYSFAGGSTAQQVDLCVECNKTECKNYSGFTLVDGKPFCCLVSGWGGNGSFTYSRNISNKMGTVCLPYSMNAGSKSDAYYYTLGKCDEDNDVLLFDRVTGVLEAFTPAIYITVANNPTSINFDNLGSAAFSAGVTTNQEKDAARGSSEWKMIGTVKSGTASESSNSIYYVKDGGFKRCNVNITYKPYRAYITGPAGGSSVKAFGIADDMEDAINSLTETENGEIQLYDLNGRKVNEIRNGEVYIMNGRKVMFNK